MPISACFAISGRFIWARNFLKTWRLKLFFTSLSFSLLGQLALAIEVQPFAGSLSYSSLDGCCISTGNKVGFGVLARMQTEKMQDWDFMGYTDKRWSEFSVMKPKYLIGKDSGLDPSDDEGIEVRRLNRFKLIFSYGAGFFMHSTRTKNFDLPAISSGLSVMTMSQALYTINDKWAAVGMGQASVSFAIDDKGFLWGLFLGVNWRP